jgi:3-hydroxyisobutyrate dehydrogenase
VRVGFIGLGHMGGPMSANVLAAGHDLAVHDARPEAAAGLLAAEAAWAGTPRETGAGRDVVITMRGTWRTCYSVGMACSTGWRRARSG